jgi:hypothetical protein
MVKTIGAEVVWTNRRLPFEGGKEALLDEFAWHIPPAGSRTTQAGPTKTFYAECYGGIGIHHNGGGVRCAWTGSWLVKGVGINLLSGYSDEYATQYRKNGRASLCEILVEAIWGEVLQHVLPYGAVRMTAVIRTGETLDDPAAPTGGIGVREFVWRPAHFLRATAFHVRPEHRALIPSDTARVKESIACLPHMLPMPSTLTEQELFKLGALDRLKLGLEEMVRRVAEQMATAKARRLSHGTLTASNVSLDGRWNDLNSVSALPSYGYRRNMTPFWEDHLSLNRTINSLCFYIGKYFPAISGHSAEEMPTSAWLAGIYRLHFTDALSRRFVSICGYPDIVAARIWATADGKSAMRTLSQQLIALARSGHSPRRPFDDEMHKNTVRGDYDLPGILVKMSARGSADCRDAGLFDLIADPETRQSFVRHYRTVESMMSDEARKLGVTDRAFATLVSINCRKVGRNIPLLYRNVIFDKCRQLAEHYRELAAVQDQVTSVFEPVIQEARVLYQQPSDFRTLLWCTDAMTLAYDAALDCLVADLSGQECYLPRSVKPDSTHPHPAAGSLLASAYGYWGRALEEIMQ